MLKGWQITQEDRLIYRSSSSIPSIKIKGYFFPNYRQKVDLVSFIPQPKFKIKKLNRQWIVSAKSSKRGIIIIKRTANIFPQPFIPNLSNLGQISDIDPKMRKKYRSDKYWPVIAKEIQEISKQEWFQEDNLIRWVFSAYKFIRNVLFEPSPQEHRLGPLKAIRSGKGDCDEFTDIFITLCRKKGIPTRRLTGFFINTPLDNEKKNVLSEAHAWAELYTPNDVWIPIDISLNNIGKHTINYIVLKTEEFSSNRPDLSVSTNSSTNVDFQWITGKTTVEPLLES